MNTTYTYSSTQNMGELITSNPDLLLTLTHFGIPLGFGDSTIGEVCAAHGVDAEFFLLICTVYSTDSFTPTPADIVATDMRGLVPYLLSSHDYYLNRRLPHIGEHLRKIAAMLPPRAGKAILRFFDAYVGEVSAHFAHEEKIVYPHIGRLLEGDTSDTFMIRDFLDTHENLDDKLSDLVQIIFKYLPASDRQDDTIDMIFDVLQLSHDLRKHSLIENKILGPYVKHLEKTCGR